MKIPTKKYCTLLLHSPVLLHVLSPQKLIAAKMSMKTKCENSHDKKLVSTAVDFKVTNFIFRLGFRSFVIG